MRNGLSKIHTKIQKQTQEIVRIKEKQKDDMQFDKTVGLRRN